MSDREADLVIVGAGLAGLVAANRAGELGQRVILLERSSMSRHPCASRANGGVFHVGFRSVMTDPEELVYVILAATSNFTERSLALALAHNAERSIRWLQKAGAQFTSMQPDEGWKDYCLAPLGFHEKSKMEWEDLGADRLIDHLERRAVEVGGTSLRGRVVVDLVVEDGRVCGVIADGEAGREEYRAKAIVLADGGFEGNADMVRRYISSFPSNLKLRGTESGLGDGMRLAEAAGGKLIGMDAFYGHILSADSLHSETLSPFPFLEFLASAGLMLDFDGNRFVDETKGGHFTSNILARHKTGLAQVLFDTVMWNGIGRHFFCPPNPNLIKGGGTLHAADNISDLAKMIDVDPEQLQRHVNDHNAEVARTASETAASVKSRAAMTAYAKGKHARQSFGTAPFYAAPACAAVTSTLGGIAIDANARVLSRTGGVVPNLYAAGSVAGGIEGGPEVGYLGGLIKALVFGLLAAEHAVQSGGHKQARRIKT